MLGDVGVECGEHVVQLGEIKSGRAAVRQCQQCPSAQVSRPDLNCGMERLCSAG